MSDTLVTSPLMAVIDAVHMQHIKATSDQWVAALRRARATPEEPDNATVDLIIAAEAIEDAAKHAKAVLRERLGESMERDGVTGFETAHHQITRRKANQVALITDEKALAAQHPELMTTPEPRPDRTEIARRLRKGDRIQGAELTNGGAPVVVISAKKGTSA
nr:siphovirus Gp157 family protein [uncultured Lichenicoccus sp.]